MKTDKENLSANVYNLDINGVGDTYMWDFGAFVLYGSKKYPLRDVTNMDTYSSVLNGIDGVEISEKDPDFTKNVNAFVGDYTVYVETSFENASHFISEVDSVYSVVYHKIESSEVDDSEDDYIVLKSESRRGSENTLFSVDDVRSNWTPVIEAH